MLITAIFAIGLSISSFAEEKKIYLIEKDSSQKIERQLIGLADGHDNSPSVGTMDMNLIGACVGPDKCQRSIILDNRLNEVLARSNGVNELPESRRIKTGMLYPIETESQLKAEGQLETTFSIMGSKTTKTYSLSNTRLSVNFSEEITGGNRFDYKEASTEQQKLAAGVFQIHSADEDDGLSGTSNGHGTGFFISDSGYAMTNLHVMRSRPECLRQGSCKIPVTTRQDTRETKEVEISVLTCSASLDFCLIKINPEEIDIPLHFDVNTETISARLLSLGFAGDRREKNDSEEEEETCLTYTQGTPVGISGTGLTSSLRIAGGASGSPVIDELTSDVIGILSNGAQIDDGKSGMPGIFRPMALIEKEHELSKYLDGSKQTKIDSVLDKIEASNTTAEVLVLLNDFERERSFYGLERIQDIAVYHQSLEVRRALMNYIRRRVQRI